MGEETPLADGRSPPVCPSSSGGPPATGRRGRGCVVARVEWRPAGVERMRRIAWRFPAPMPHDGIPLANGRFGALLWGEGGELRVTVNRSDYWDRRWGFHWGPDLRYANLKRLLTAGDHAGLHALFPPSAERTTRLPMGRVDLRLEGADIQSGALDLETATGQVELGGGAVSAVVLHDRPVLVLRLPRGVRAAALAVPAWEGLPGSRERAPRAFFEANGYGVPEAVAEADETGWTMERPGGEPALAVLARSGAGLCLVSAVYGEGRAGAVAAARGELDEATARVETLLAGSRAAWKRFWREGARIEVPDPEVADLYHLGVYKAACLGMAGGVGATLQGAWVEEYRLPPWSSDYHFNINVQECYWPVCAGNHPELMRSLFDLVDSWEGRLRDYARTFVGVEDGRMLPHAVNDRCDNVGGFWTGSIDHGSTVWVGQLMWTYWRHTLDRGFLRDRAYPFLRGAMRVVEAMLEEDGGAYALPVSVSPEYGATGDGEIALWAGQPLAESHRHHSHLAGLYPFDTLDAGWRGVGGRDAEAVRRSLRTWVRCGMGQWTGWCVPWAAILHARVGNGDMAETLLQIFARAFVTKGRASLHDAGFPGFTVFDGRRDVMQVEAAVGFAAAVQEMLLHTARLRPSVVASYPSRSAAASTRARVAAPIGRLRLSV